MKTSDNPDWFELEELYEEGRRLFLRGKYEEAIDAFKRIYEVTLELRDVVQIVEDCIGLPRQEWIAKYQAHFNE
jgi:hypothetical protein